MVMTQADREKAKAKRLEDLRLRRESVAAPEKWYQTLWAGYGKLAGPFLYIALMIGFPAFFIYQVVSAILSFLGGLS